MHVLLVEVPVPVHVNRLKQQFELKPQQRLHRTRPSMRVHSCSQLLMIRATNFFLPGVLGTGGGGLLDRPEHGERASKVREVQVFVIVAREEHLHDTLTQGIERNL